MPVELNKVGHALDHDCACPTCGDLLFVYGSLKKGGVAHEKLARGTLVDSNIRVPGILVPVSWYPALHHCSGCWVRGELYRVPKSVISEIDIFEGVAQGLYIRTKTFVDHAPGTAWVYRFGRGLTPSESTLVIADGNYDVNAKSKQTVVPLSVLRANQNSPGIPPTLTEVVKSPSPPTYYPVSPPPLPIRVNEILLPPQVAS